MLGTLGMLVGATLQNTANPTMLQAGYKHNVIPGEAVASIDGRVLPGYEDEFEETIRRIVGDAITVESVVRTSRSRRRSTRPTVDLMAAALRAEDPGARAVPYMISGGTDAKAFSALGIDCYGFSPLQAARRRRLLARCSTASTSACRSTASTSACGCSTASCGPPDPRQAVRMAR